MKITAFQGTHRFTFVSGDKTHPTCDEIILEYRAEVERARRVRGNTDYLLSSEWRCS